MEIDWNAILLDPIRAFFGQLGSFLPNLLAVVAILVGGWIVAKVIQMVLVSSLPPPSCCNGSLASCPPL